MGIDGCINGYVNKIMRNLSLFFVGFFCYVPTGYTRTVECFDDPPALPMIFVGSTTKQSVSSQSYVDHLPIQWSYVMG